MTAHKGAAGMAAHPSRGLHGLVTARPIIVGGVRLLLTNLSTVAAAPVLALDGRHEGDAEVDDGNIWVLWVASIMLVLLGGAFAGLTIALMGQDGIYLQVISRDRSEPQFRNAKRVYKLLQNGKHWVLVTLLLCNVIVNETLPVVLDRCLGGGVAAVVGSTVLIVIFGEIIPQSLCVRYGLQIGGAMAKAVRLLMYFLAPIAWPTAKLLDKLLGEDHGTVYKKSGLKTLVTLHKTLGDHSQRLNEDEVTIISAVLDLKEKPVEQVMTPMDDVFTMSEDTVLDESTTNMILSAGYSRIPIHETGNPTNFVGMLLVKILITYDPEDAKRVKSFPLATLPETRPETSCLDIMNFFQEGKSHMVLVSDYPGEDHGAIGVVTLEDVIEELIGEEIIDESDVYIDVHKAIRRLAPAPKARIQQRSSEVVNAKSSDEVAVFPDQDMATDQFTIRPARLEPQNGRNDVLQVMSTSPKTATFMMRRSSAGVGGDTLKTSYPVRANIEEMREHLKHLGPSNPATNPKSTRSTTVKIKHGAQRAPSVTGDAAVDSQHGGDNETTSLLTVAMPSQDGVQALMTEGYGAAASDGYRSKSSGRDVSGTTSAPRQMDDATQTLDLEADNNSDTSLRNYRAEYSMPKRSYVRSGSITENIIESRGVRKVVLEMSSNEEEDNSAAFHSSPDAPKSQKRSSLGLFGIDSATEEQDAGQSLTECSEQQASAGPSWTGPGLGGGDGEDDRSQTAGEAGAQNPRKKQRKKKRSKGNQW